jgi:hypothetical protein
MYPGLVMFSGPSERRSHTTAELTRLKINTKQKNKLPLLAQAVSVSSLAASNDTKTPTACCHMNKNDQILCTKDRYRVLRKHQSGPQIESPHTDFKEAKVLHGP